MPVGNAQHQPSGTGRHLLLYDGLCGFCNGQVRGVLARDQRAIFHFASLQSPAARVALARFGACPEDAETFRVIVNYQGDPSEQLSRARAALFVLKELGWPWRAAGLLGVLPTALLDRAYDLVARNRYGLGGRRDMCLAPPPHDRHRFLDIDAEALPKPEGP